MLSLSSGNWKTQSSPYLNHFLQPDTIIPDLSNPQSWNRYSYVGNRPIVLNDPTGHDPWWCDSANCEAKYIRTPVPDWWKPEKEHIYVKGYGYFDTGHIRRGWQTGNYLVNLKLEEDGGDFPMESKSGMFPTYTVMYSVSKNVTKDQIKGVLYGIFTDFEYSYEQHQGTREDKYSSFAPEDTPSDHIGFWAAINGKGINEIPPVLESLGKVSAVPYPGGTFVWDSFGVAKNHQFLPMVPRTVRTGITSVTQMVNIPWPSWLEIDPIPSGPDTWQRK